MMRLRVVWEHMRATYWAVPSAIALAAVGAAFLMTNVDQALTATFLNQLSWVYTGGPDGARAVLSTKRCRMKRIKRLLFVVCFGVATPVAAQVVSDDPTVAVANIEATEMAASSTFSPTSPRPEGTIPTDTAPSAVTQTSSSDVPVPTPPHTGIRALGKALVQDVIHLPTKGNAFILTVGAIGAAAVHPIDDTANAKLSGPRFEKTFKAGAIMGGAYVLLPAAVSIYAVGRTQKLPRVSHIGSDLIESLAVTELVTQSLKYTVRRERPDGSGANSFPSGHAAATMAFATTLERHFGWRLYLPAYAAASYVAMSRLHDNRHYVSDVVFGSAVGIISARAVTRHGRENFPVQAMAIPGGVAVVYTR